MISAKDAKKLYDATGAEVDEYLLNNVEPAVIKAAKDGKREVTVLLGILEYFEGRDFVISPLQANVTAKLRNLGYVVNISWIAEAYLKENMFTDGPVHRNYGYVIKW